jgi:hypothetical protein
VSVGKGTGLGVWALLDPQSSFKPWALRDSLTNGRRGCVGVEHEASVKENHGSAPHLYPSPFSFRSVSSAFSLP